MATAVRWQRPNCTPRSVTVGRLREILQLVAADTPRRSLLMAKYSSPAGEMAAALFLPRRFTIRAATVGPRQGISAMPAVAIARRSLPTASLSSPGETAAAVLSPPLKYLIRTAIA